MTEKHRLRSIDPMLSFAYSKDDLPLRDDETVIPGFVIMRSGDRVSVNGLRIMILGGSTSGPYFNGNWPRQFRSMLDREGITATVYNGAVSAYSTNQELLKFIRDGLALRPDLVISLSGVNDLGFMHSIRKHPMHHPYTSFILQSLLRNQVRGKQKGDIINDLNFGPPIETTPADQWERNIRLMNAITSEYGIKYYAFLQPTLGIGDYHPTPQEQQMLEAYIHETNGRYLNDAHEFYESALARIKTCEFVFSLVDIFKSTNNIYYNPRHPNADGYAIIANAVFNRLKHSSFFVK